MTKIKDAVEETKKAAARPADKPAEPKAAPFTDCKAMKLGVLTDTGDLKEFVEHTKKAAARTESAEDKPGNKCLGNLVDMKGVNEAVKAAVEAASRKEEAKPAEETCAEVDAEEEGEAFEGLW